MPRELAAVLILAGGSGRRLGTPKAWLDWNGVPLLLHVIDRLALLASPVLVSARVGQDLPRGPYERVEDSIPDAGPLAGLAAGLGEVARVDPKARVAVCACDYPFADPGLFRALAAADAAAVVLPSHDGHDHPLHAVWRAGAASACARALADGDRRVSAALDALETRVIPAARLASATALLNVNDPATLARARAIHGTRDRSERRSPPNAPPTSR